LCLDAVRLLLEHGADPNAREAGDNATTSTNSSSPGSSKPLKLRLLVRRAIMKGSTSNSTFLTCSMGRDSSAFAI